MRGAARRAAVPALLILLAAPATAQTLYGEPRDLQFEIANATTGQPGACDRLTIDAMSARLDNVADVRPEGAQFTLPAIPLSDQGLYLVTVWHQGVPYFFSKRGREWASGPQVLHVFDTTANLDQVSITGLSLVIRRQESLLRLEYMLQIQNQARPQATVLGDPQTFLLDFPDGAQDVAAYYHRGPEPTVVPARRDGGKLGLAAPLISGTTTVRIEAALPWSEGMTLPIGADIPVESWSALVSPQWVQVSGLGVEPAQGQAVQGFQRFSGAPLPAGRSLELQLASGEGRGAPPGAIFSDSTAAATDGAGGPAAGKGGDRSTAPLIVGGILIILVIASAVLRRLRG